MKAVLDKACCRFFATEVFKPTPVFRSSILVIRGSFVFWSEFIVSPYLWLKFP